MTSECTISVRSAIDWPCSIDHVLLWISMHQTLVAAAIAAAAALYTVKAINSQAALVEEHRRDELKRRFRAARAGLPNALRELTEFSDQTLEVLWRARHDAWSSAGDLIQPEAPYSALQTIQSAIESADDDLATELEKLLRFAQIHASRVGSHFRSSVIPTDQISDRSDAPDQFLSEIIDTLLLAAASARLFAPARGQLCEDYDWWDENRVKSYPALALLPRSGGTFNVDDRFDELVDRDWKKRITGYDRL